MDTSATRTSRSTLGLLIYGAEDPTCRALWKGVDDVAREHDFNLVSFRAEPLHIPLEYLAQCNVLYQMVSDVRLDGLIVWGGILAHYVSQDEVLTLLENYRHLPLVNLSSELPRLPNVLIDNYRGTYEIVSHLIEEHGLRDIAFIRGPAGHVEAEARYRGYQEALRDHGLEMEPNRVVPGDFARGTGLEAMRVLMDERKATFDAVVAANDQLAIDVIEALQARGYHVPRDAAVVGFDNRPETRFVTPPLTTIAQPWREMGRRAAEMLVEHLEQGTPLRSEIVKVPPRLVLRESCGCLERSVRLVASPAAPRFLTAEGAVSSETAIARVASELREAMASDLHVPQADGGLEALLQAFLEDLADPSRAEFLSRLEMLLRFSAERGDHLRRWHDLISLMRRALLPTLTSVEQVVRAEDLWQQARVMIGEWTTRLQALARLDLAQRQTELSEIEQTLSAALGVEGLMERVSQAVERLHIPRCYLSLYQDPENPAARARLALAYTYDEERGFVRRREKEGELFSSPQLLPMSLWPSRRVSLHVEPLYFRTDQLGLLLFEAQPERGEVYDILQRDISRALYGSLLLERAERRAAQIQTAAEVAQVTGQILDTDVLIQRVVDLVRERFDLYYVGLFLVDEAGTWAKLRAGTGPAGEAMVAEGHRLRIGGDSMIGQCVARQEARIALDVGAEAVRFDNPLLPETRSEMALPLVTRGEVLGALTIQSAEPGAFSEVDIISFQVMANQLANAIANAHLYEQAQREIAERRRTEEALAYQEYLLRVLLDNTPDHIFFKDRQSRFIEVSRALVEWFGAESREEIIGKTDFDFFAEAHARPAYEDEQQVIRTGEPILAKEEKEVWPDGRVTWVSTSKLPMRDQDGHIVGIFGVSRNITPLKEAMDEQERLLKVLGKRSEQLQLAADVAQEVVSILEPETLLSQVVDLVRRRFGFYHVGLFLVVEVDKRVAAEETWAVLRGASGEAGRRMLEAEYRLAVDDTSTVGRCILEGEVQRVLDLEEGAHPYLPEARSEMALPLVSRGRPLGALVLYATAPDAFTPEDATVFQPLAGQIAVAIENARLLEEVQSALDRMAAAQRHYMQQAWDKYLEPRRDAISYHRSESTAEIVDEQLKRAVERAMRTQEVVVLTADGHADGGGKATLVVPAVLRGQAIGALAVRSLRRSWSSEEIALARLLAERMVLIAENLRLFEAAQRTAARERLLGEVASRVRERLDVETVLRTAADEIYRALDLESVTVRLTEDESAQS
ncbi:MAG: GAF domain-containing protein [Anaerolineae bacterium]